nr:hypothetical protein [uncultured Desulfobacter sp.]
MAHVVLLMGKGGQRRAERELGWTRDIIRKGMKELKSGIVCIDNFSGRGVDCRVFILGKCQSILPTHQKGRPNDFCHWA